MYSKEQTEKERDLHRIWLIKYQVHDEVCDNYSEENVGDNEPIVTIDDKVSDKDGGGGAE